MQALKVKILLLFTLFMFTAKPFVGFGLYNQLQDGNETTILVKAFTKRKQEYVDGSEYDMVAIQQRLNHAGVSVLLLLSFFLNRFFSIDISFKRRITNQTVLAISRELLPAQHRYLLTRKLII